MALRRSGRQLTKQCEAQVEGGDGAARSLRQNVPMEHLRALERAHVCERHAYQFQGHKVGWLEAQRLCSNATKRQASGGRRQASGMSAISTVLARHVYIIMVVWGHVHEHSCM